MTTVNTPTTAKTAISAPIAPDAIQTHQEAENALSMALHYMRQPTSNVPGARRKAVQAIAALNTLHMARFGLAANDSKGA